MVKRIAFIALLAAIILISGCVERHVQYCLKDDVVGVYNCKDNSLKVVYSLLGRGFDIIKGNGSYITCNIVGPEYMSDACKAAMAEDYCEAKNLCLEETTTTAMETTTLPGAVTTTTVQETTTTTAPIVEKGGFNLMISDAQADIEDFDKLIVDLSKARVFMEGNDTEPGFFEMDINASVDITQVVGEKAISVLNVNLDVGVYSKVELHVSAVNGTVNGTEADVKVPSNKLQITKQFEIKPNETTKFVFDINVVKKGNNLEYNLLPVIAKSGVAGKDVDVNETECTVDADCDENETCIGNECKQTTTTTSTTTSSITTTTSVTTTTIIETTTTTSMLETTTTAPTTTLPVNTTTTTTS